MNRDYIYENAKIYGQNSQRTLTEYEQRINQASIELCLHNPNLMSDRNTLLVSASKQVDESGYSYKKGKSHSRRLNPDDTCQTPKRNKVSKDYRLARITELNEQINDMTDQLGYKEKCRESANNICNYKECDKLTEEMSQLKADRRQLEVALTKKQKKIEVVLQ